MFKLVNSETKPLTPALAAEFAALEASPTEREYDEARARMLRDKAEHGQLIAFSWAKANLGDKVYRMNGQHSSKVLVDLNGNFPEGSKAHIDTYKVDSVDDLAELFRQFDSRKSGRTPSDVSGAYQGLQSDLADVQKPSAKLAVEGVNWFDKHVVGAPAPKGDDVYSLLQKAQLHPFIQWVGDLFTIKTPELRRQTIVAAMYGTFDANETEAKKFWADVSRGGVEFEESHPATVLDAFLKSVAEDKRKLALKPANLYQACIYAWNAFREEKTITSVKYDTKKGFYQVTA